MNIKDERFVQPQYDRYEVYPCKLMGDGKYYGECNPDYAEQWAVRSHQQLNEGVMFITLARFEDQDLAHQFAELLTICLNQIKTFQSEILQTETK